MEQAVLSPIEIITNADVPKQTRTYTPISHTDLINEVKEKLDKANLKIKNEYYSENRSGQQMFGNFTVTADDEMDMNIGFRNSYDKSMQMGLVAGTRVIVCSNLMFKGDFRTMMMHRGEIAAEVSKEVEAAVKSLEKNYSAIRKDSDSLKSVCVDKHKTAELVGEMLLYENLITSTQLKIIKNELVLKENFSDETMWDIYNHTTEALKTCPVSNIVDNHIGVHQYFMSKV
jgi:hypothetical protein